MGKSLVVFVTMLSITVSLLFAEPPIEAVEEKFASIASFEASFSQITIPAVGDTQKFEGILYLSRPESVRMEISSPQEQLIVFNGERAWLYLPQQNTCYLYSKQSIGNLVRIPEYIFNPFEKLVIDTSFTTDTCLVISFTAPENDPYIAGVDLTVPSTSLLPCRILIKDRAGTKMEYAFSSITVNGSDTVSFTFSPPEHTTVIER